MPRWGNALLALTLGGCGFGGGNGVAETDGDTDDSSTAATDEGTNSDPATPPDTTAITTTTDAPPTASTDAETANAEDTNEACAPFSEFYWAQDVPDTERTLGERPASLLPPHNGEPVAFVFGEQEQQGFANFAFEVPCADEVTLWALVWDAEAGTVDNADSFFFNLDESDITSGDAIWEYGCDSVGQGRTWRWQRVRETGAACDNSVPWIPLDAGEHNFRILHREEVSFQPIDFNFAGIAALAVTNDASYDPVDDYSPVP